MGIAFKSEKDIAGELAPAQFTDQHPTDLQIMDPNDAEVTSCLSSDLQSQSLDDKQTSDPNSVQNQSDVGNSGQEKVIKKPDKILPCPRCNSMDTKFCYYNNYNINQPRHFCKSCQRYWTAGGTMRNVPVGAGRRKSKSASQQHRQLNSSCVAPSAGSNVPDSTSKHVLNCGVSSFMHAKGNGAGKLSKDAIFCESEVRTAIPEEHKGKEDMVSKDCEENGEDPNCTCVNFSKFTEDNTPDEGNEAAPNVSLPSCNGLAPMHPLQCYPGPPWTVPWNPGWNNLAAMATSGRCGLELAHGQENGSVHPFSWNPPPIVAAPSFCAPTVPLPFMPASFWGCMPSWPNGAWGMPWVGSPGGLTPTSTGNAGCLSNNSPLGKHSRDMASGTEDKRENSVWVPKTLRIDDPDEAAKSSIWATLGIKPGKKEPSANGGIFKGFQTQNGENNQQSDATHVLHANPAAFCRSQTFQESS